MKKTAKKDIVDKKKRKPKKGDFKKGTSGNPAGRPPKGYTWGDTLKEIGNEWVLDDDRQRVRRKELIARKLYEKAQNEVDVKAIEKIMDREDGKPKQEIESTVHGEIRQANIIVDGKIEDA